MAKEIRINEPNLNEPLSDLNPIFQAYEDEIDFGLINESYGLGELEELYVGNRIRTQRDRSVITRYKSDHPVESYADKLRGKHKLEKIEAEVLGDFLVNWRRPERPRRYQELIGDVGVGKSMLIQYVFEYILGAKERFFDNGLYVKLDLKEKLDETNKILEKGYIGLKQLLSSEIYTQVYHSYVKEHPQFDSELWSFVSALEKSNPFIEQVAIVQRTRAELKAQKISEVYEWISKDPELVFELNVLRLKYLFHVLDGRVCLVVDNSDTIPTVLLPQLRSLVLHIQQVSNICIVFCLRYRSIGRIDRSGGRLFGDHNPYWVVVSPPDITKVAEKRATFIINRIKSGDSKDIPLHIGNFQLVVKKEHACEVVGALIGTFCSKDAASHLSALANNDIRRGLLLVDRLCQANLDDLDLTRVIKELWRRLNKAEEFWDNYIPLYEVRKIHVLNGNPVFITADDRRSDTVENVFCCKENRLLGNNLIKYRMLELLCRHSERMPIFEIFHLLEKCFGYSRGIFDKGLEQLFQRPKKLLWAMNASRASDLDFEYDSVELTAAGKYYIQSFCMTFDYLLNMFLDSYVHPKYRVPLKPYHEYNEPEKWEMLLSFSSHIHEKDALEFKGSPTISFALYQSLTEFRIRELPEFRMLTCLEHHLKKFRRNDFVALRMPRVARDRMLGTIAEKRKMFLQTYEAVADPQSFPTLYD